MKNPVKNRTKISSNLWKKKKKFYDVEMPIKCHLFTLKLSQLIEGGK